MDETTVREAAETHAQATVERDYSTAGSYLSKEMQASAGEVMQEMPRPLTGSEVVSTWRPRTARRRPGSATRARRVRRPCTPRWEDVDGKPTIVGLDVVEKA